MNATRLSEAHAEAVRREGRRLQRRMIRVERRRHVEMSGEKPVATMRKEWSNVRSDDQGRRRNAVA
jgi:hypothetical protein